MVSFSAKKLQSMDLDSDLFAPRRIAFGFGQNWTATTETETASALEELVEETEQLQHQEEGEDKDGYHCNSFNLSHGELKLRQHKGWSKMLKSATKHFKRKKKDPTVHVKLSNYLRDF
uniref:Uncharacterized protein n=1 Tax=Salix viminalis TaxID=40686 RepID=A0A6N2LDI1_SALVM